MLGVDGGDQHAAALLTHHLARRQIHDGKQRLANQLLRLVPVSYTHLTDNFAFVFAHKEQLCSPCGKRVHDPNAPYDAYYESDDTEQSDSS